MRIDLRAGKSRLESQQAINEVRDRLRSGQLNSQEASKIVLAILEAHLAAGPQLTPQSSQG